MVEYLRLFENEADYKNARLNDYYEPWVSATKLSDGDPSPSYMEYLRLFENGVDYDEVASPSYMEYLRLFENGVDYDTEMSNDDYNPLVLATNLGEAANTSHRVNYNKSVYEKLLETPLTFEITSDGNIVWKTGNSAYITTLEYSINDSEWSGITSNTGSSAPSISVVSGDTIQFRGNNDTYATSNTVYNSFGGTAEFNIKGNIMSLIDSENFITATTLTKERTFFGLFSGCTSLMDASQLVLPASNLTSTCYASMFRECRNLKKAPELMATTLANFCYQGMFRNCVNLASAPSTLPALVAPKSCYQNMFTCGTTLTEAPELPATTLGESCYDGMFQFCTNLARASKKLPATILPTRCYANMFQNTKITSAPEILASDFGSKSCQSMFIGCKSLTTAIMVGTCGATMAESACTQMFQNCTSLTTAPSILPATTLAERCYYQMFKGCTSLTTAPELPATTLVSSCYYQMFHICSRLNYIKAMFTTTPGSSYTNGWVIGVASTGTFVKNSAATWDVTGASGIPTGWTVQTAAS